MSRRILVYDVADDRRRTRLARLLERCGTRVQYSVFEAWLDRAELERLLEEARGLLDAGTDDLRAYQVCARCASKLRAVGRSEARKASPPEGYRLV